MPKVLVAGASGLVGNAAMHHFAGLPGWDVVGVSRRVPRAIAGAAMLPLDLLDKDACNGSLANLGDVTHVVYAALQEAPGLFQGWLDEELIERNATMLRNLCEPLFDAAKGLEHISLLHGTKAYGIHHPSIGTSGLRVPLREREPRREHRNFYFEQEDYLGGKQERHGFGLTMFRPTVIYGGAWGNNMNPLPVIAAYGALLRDAGEPLHFPGRSTEPVVREAVDADLVASALGWAATSPDARGETFNLTNGDVFSWESVWPGIAEALGMQTGEHRPFSFAKELPGRQGEWERLVEKYVLAAPENLLEFVGENSLIYTDMLFAGPRPGAPILNSTIKARHAGFADCMDTEDMFRKWLARLADERVIPAAR